jgi:hypothetical protein
VLRGYTNLVCKGQFLVDELEEVVWNSKAFENLVLLGGEKELVWDFAESKNMSNYVYDDFIHEKGILSTRDLAPMFYPCIGGQLLIVKRPRCYYPHVWTSWGGKDLHRRSRY